MRLGLKYQPLGPDLDPGTMRALLYEVRTQYAPGSDTCELATAYEDAMAELVKARDEVADLKRMFDEAGEVFYDADDTE